MPKLKRWTKRIKSFKNIRSYSSNSACDVGLRKRAPMTFNHLKELYFLLLYSSMKTLSVDMSTALLSTKKSHGQSSTSNCKDQTQHLRGYFDKMKMICIFGIIKYDILWFAVPEDSLTRMKIRVESWIWCRGKSLVRVEQGRGRPQAYRALNRLG